MKSFLQKLHFVLFIFTIVLGSLLYYYSEEGDVIKSAFALIGFLLVIIWPILLIIYGVAKGTMVDKSTLIVSVYRRLLIKSLFLYISNTILLLLMIVSIYFLLNYRQVEFATNTAESLTVFIDIDNTEADLELGKVSSQALLKKRLKLGTYEIYYIGNKIKDGKTIVVESIFKHPDPIIIKIENE